MLTVSIDKAILHKRNEAKKRFVSHDKHIHRHDLTKLHRVGNPDLSIISRKLLVA